MFKWIAAAVLAVMTVPAQALVGFTIVADGHYVARDARGNVTSDFFTKLTSTFYGETWDSDFWFEGNNPFGSCSLNYNPNIAPCATASRDGNVLVFRVSGLAVSYGIFSVNLTFDRDIESDPSAFEGAGFVSGLYAYSYGHHSGSISLTGPVVIAAGIPEPATWAMLIAGFGLAGAALRRRSAGTAMHWGKSPSFDGR
jgi:hypothetical protein